MEISFAMLAESATIVNNRLYMLGGGIRGLRADKFPFACPLAFAAEVSLQPEECGRTHVIEVRLIDADGQRVGATLTGNLNLNADPKFPTKPIFWKIVMAANPQVFPRPGEYRLDVLSDGHLAKSLDLIIFPPKG